MDHGTPLITTIVAGLVLAFIFGSIANRFRLPPLVGYLLAGVIVGPYSPGFVADQELALELSEIGVILLMFGVGLHFSLKDLISVQALAVPGALGRIAVGTLMGMGLAALMGWSLFAGLIFGLCLSVASTVVLLKTLQDRHLIDTERGRIAVGWVIVEDIAMVLALVLVPAFASLAGGTVTTPPDAFVSFVERVFSIELGIPGIIAVTVVKLAAFVGFMLIVGRRLIPMILHYTAHGGSRELFRLAVLAIALGVAAGSAYLFGVSLALGAFFAGMILSESELSHRAAQETLPLRDAFAVLFFVAVGMLFDPMIIVRSPLPVLGVLFIILFGKSAVAFFIILAFRRSPGTALTISASLAQVGEFSFILASLGTGLGILPPEGRDLILAGAIVSIVLNPLMFWVLDRLRPRLDARLQHRRAARAEAVEPSLAGGTIEPPETAAAAELEEADEKPHPTALSGHAVVVGYGRVGQVIAEGLARAHAPHLVIEDAESRVAAAKAAGAEVVIGNAATADALRLANVAGARALFVAIPNSFEAGQVTEQGRKLNPSIKIIARSHSEEEEAHLKHLGADGVIMGEREIALGMLAWLVTDAQAEPPATPEPMATAAAAAATPADLAEAEPAAASTESVDAPVVHPDPEVELAARREMREPVLDLAGTVLVSPPPDDGAFDSQLHRLARGPITESTIEDDPAPTEPEPELARATDRDDAFLAAGEPSANIEDSEPAWEPLVAEPQVIVVEPATATVLPSEDLPDDFGLAADEPSRREDSSTARTLEAERRTDTSSYAVPQDAADADPQSGRQPPTGEDAMPLDATGADSDDSDLPGFGNPGGPDIMPPSEPLPPDAPPEVPQTPDLPGFPDGPGVPQQPDIPPGGPEELPPQHDLPGDEGVPLVRPEPRS